MGTQNTPYAGDIGTKILVDVGIPADDIVSAKLIVKKPDGTVVEWPASPVLGTTQISYIVQSGDFDQAGRYQLQAFVQTGDWSGYGEITYFYVKNHL